MKNELCPQDFYQSCRLCPRNCGVNRLAGERGFCGEDANLRIAFAGLHMGEEPPLVGTGGSGTIFISGCNLGCVFCQNWQISQGKSGERLGNAVSAEDFARICAALRDKGAENINIVTGSHAIPAIIRGICAARGAGVRLPVLWNTSAYENVETLELLRDYVDIFLPDIKTLDSGIAEKLFNAPDYPAVAQAAILKMCGGGGSHSSSHSSSHSGSHRNHHNHRVIVRHLVLPGYLEATRGVLQWFAENVKERALLSLMTQYTPIPGRGKAAPQRFLNVDEYETVLGWLEEFGIEDGFCQELVTGSDWLPDFKLQNPFSSELSVPVYPASAG